MPWQQYQPAPSGHWDICHRAPYTYTHPVSWGVLEHALHFQWERFCSRHVRSGDVRCTRQTSSEDFSFLRVCSNQSSLLIYQRGYTFFALSLLISVHVELLLDIFHIPHQVQLYLCLDFPDLISTHADNVPIFFPGYTTLLLPVYSVL